MTFNSKTNTFPSKVAAAERAMRRQSNVWRSIILSTQDETFKPYCVYIRNLDFENLHIMLEDFKFTGKTRSDFFAGTLEQFYFEIPKTKASKTTFQYLRIDPIINAIGDAITIKSAYLEGLSGRLDRSLLPEWIRHSPHLQSMTLFHGAALSEEAGITVGQHAQYFKDLTILEWRQPDSDEIFGTFLRRLKPHTLETLAMISSNGLGKLAFDGLATHATSLKYLRLNNLTEKAVTNLHKLRSCTSIKTLMLEDNTRGQVHLETDHHDVFVEIVAWLSACTQLRDVSLKSFFDGPAILALVLSSQAVKLDRLSLEGYELRLGSSMAFHTALSDQRQLTTLELKGSCEDANADHFTILIEALCNLDNLQTLRLKDISDDFEEHHITNLALGLPQLEDFWTSGQNVGADVLPVLGSMKQLKTLNLCALTQFNCTDILDFVELLDPEAQRGFNLSLMAQDSEYNLSEEEQELIRDVMRDRLDGRLDFDLWREDESENSDDD